MSLTDADIKKLSAVLATKDDIASVQSDIIQLDNRMIKVEERMEAFEKRHEEMLKLIDKISQRLDGLDHEYVAFKLTMDRHERWIKEIAEKSGVTLTPA